MQLGIGVCLLSLPWAVLPREVLETCITPLMKAGTQVDEALWSLDKYGQDLRCERVDGEHMRQPIFGGDAPRLPIANGRIVNYPVEGAESVDLIRHAASLGDTRQITYDNSLRSRHG